ncbi:acyltransferase domain-containing protein, partial [Candidatus Sumerlaeota bacterium]|nr:acyltransferase domain-containing protein [Candidatus Sumerlaeota bacterium]
MSKTAKRTSTATTPLAIVGMGCRFPKADSLGEYESNIANRVDGITDVPPSHWNPADYFDSDPKAPDKVYSARGGFLSPIDFNPMELGIAPNAIEATDTTQLFGVLVAAEALRDAGYGPGGRPFDRGRASCILGVTGTLELVIPLGARLGHPVWRRALKEAGIGDDVAEDVVHRISESYVGWQEASFPGLLGNVVAGRIANTLDLGGTNCVVDAACASALSAIHLATLELANGQSDMVVTGGMDTFNDVFMYMCFSKTPALSPTGDARPFSRDADGTILGEGLGCLVLKRLADAERDGDRIYAVIRSMGTSSDGKGQAIYAPSAAGQSRALRAAYAAIGIEPETIDLLEAHGTGTIAGDAAEIASLIDVYRKKPDEPEWCALGSVKSQIGHTKAAAGAAGLIKAALALHRQVLPPTIKVDQPAEALEPGKSAFYVNAEKRPWVGRPAHPRRAGVSSFGFGGSNFHCVLEEYRKQESTPDWDGRVQIVAFSGKDSSEIQEALMALPESPTWTQVREIAARSRRGTGVSPVVRNNLSTGAGEEHGRDAHATSRHEQDAHATAPCRLFLVVEKDGPSLSKMAADARSMFERSPEASSWNTPDGAYFGRGKAPGKLAVVFPGQGSQYAGMLRDLACAFPQMREALETADTVFAENSERRDRLSDLVYPRTAFTKEERERNEQTLRDTRVAQPAIGAMSLGAMNVLRDLGVRPDVAAGHSYGELPALCAAGCFDERALFSLSKLRGELMNNGHGDRGAMLAVRDSLDNVTRVLSSEGIDVVIANKNAPNQAVLSGRTAEIERAAQAFERHNIQTRRLVVSAAFHSALVAEASEPFLAALSRVDFAEARMPVYANTTAEEYPKTADEARTLLAGQLAHPVEFVRQIDNMYEQGARAFLEVGPGNVLTSLVRSILADLDHEAIALDSSRGRRSGIADLARALANLGALGYGVDLPKWDAEFAREALSADAQDKTKTKKPVLTIPICGANYVKPREKRAPVVASEAVRAERRGTGVSPAAHVPISGARKEHGQDAHATLPESMSEALRIAQESMAALQRIQAETAELHRRFLEGQESSQRAFRSLLERQAALLGGGTPFVQSSPERLAESAYEQREQSPAAESGTKVPRSTQEEPVRESRRGGAESVLREVIAEKTGYPAEMLEPHMTLDSDLGIDSIKRVEILSAL